MDVSLPLGLATLLDKAARDNGFDVDLPAVSDASGNWLVYRSTQCPLQVWLGREEESRLLVGLSQANVARAVELGAEFSGPVPPGARAARAAVDTSAVHKLLRRAFQLSRTLPDELLHVFEQKTADMPRATEAERLVVQRVGQDIFRAGLMDYWDGRCAITGLAVPELLRASHIKPWAACETDAERLDVFNGLLLAPHLDALFDGGFITIEAEAAVRVSARLDDEARCVLGVDGPLCVRGLSRAHAPYLAWHRGEVFLDGRSKSPRS